MSLHPAPSRTATFAWYRDCIAWARREPLNEYVRKGKYLWRFRFEKILPTDHRTGHVHRVPNVRPGLHAKNLWPPNNKGFRRFTHNALRLQWYQVKRRRKSGYGWTARKPRDSSRILRIEKNYSFTTH